MAFDGARLGFSGLADWRPVGEVYHRPAMWPMLTAQRQLHCRIEFDRAWSILDEQTRALLLAVVLRNISIGRTAECSTSRSPG
jgi:hypothetical protein